SFVEDRHSRATAEERRAAVEPYVKRMVAAGADEIVLACTHFLHLTREIAEVAGPGVEVVDSRDGVARRLARVLEERGLLLPPDAPRPPDSFLLTGALPFEESYSDFAAAFGFPPPAPLGGPPR
ncbi:MAG: aspartate/glutamate racemase family protein, partial [Spirochaetaceae bacterium]|nr:aspartate/glutamate racemase family protein [Spirochaetaceae bacterium]